MYGYSGLILIICVTDDFDIQEDSVILTSDSALNSILCFTFTPVDDTFIESSEVFAFSPRAANERDSFQDDSSEFSLVINDEDGKVESNK